MTKDQQDKIIDTARKLEILRQAAELAELLGSGCEDLEDARRLLGQYYAFVDGAQIMLRDAVDTLNENVF